MALSPHLPNSPHAIIPPKLRWYPSDVLLKESAYDKLLPPLVHKLRERIFSWRKANYKGASPTSKALLNYWFSEEHIWIEGGWQHEFRYYFAQREAVETVVYLFDVEKVKDQNDLLKFSTSVSISSETFPEDWRRFVIKMATGSGKTKVISLLLAWSYFHKLYEPHSELAKNFLLIAPNIIVLDRLRTDFDGLRIFFKDPIIPPNRYQNRNWKTDFQLTLHIQDYIKTISSSGNIFLTNIHRVYSSHMKSPSLEDKNTTEYFLGSPPVTKTTDSHVDLANIVRDIDELVIINDEAHHIHDKRLSWFKSIEDIHHRLKRKDKFLSLQIDVTATPKHNNGSIFAQTISDYPLVEAIAHKIVKQPVLPDQESRKKLQEKKTSKYTEKYRDYLHLGVKEWEKAYSENIKLEKKSILFIMTDDTQNCDEVAHYLESTYPMLKDSVLTIHTKKNGDINESQSSNKNKEELEKLRQQAKDIDNSENPYKAIVSVLVLKEGWDVKNVTTIVGLRPYNAKSNILPEQTLGRGLRRMYQENPDAEEKVSVIGTPAFMEFVESIEKEGVTLEYTPMGGRTPPKAPTIVEIDPTKTNVLELDMAIPILTPKSFIKYKNLSALEPKNFIIQKIELKKISKRKKEIHFKYMGRGKEEEYSHTTFLDNLEDLDYRGVIGFLAQTIVKELSWRSSYYIVYDKVKDFIQNDLFKTPICLNDNNVIANLSQEHVTRFIVETFKKEINKLTIQENKNIHIKEPIHLRNTRPFVVKDQSFIFVPKKSVFNKIVGDNNLEREFAAFLDQCDDIISYAKNYFKVGFKIDYINKDGDIRDYYPDFLVKRSEKEFYVIETKGREDLNDPLKLSRLKQWCKDINSQNFSIRWGFIFVDEEGFKKYRPIDFQALINTFTKYQ